MYSKHKANVNRIAFSTSRLESKHLTTEVGTTGYNGNKTRFCFRINIPERTDMIAFETDEGIIITGCGTTSLHEFYSAIKFALREMKRKMSKEDKNERV